MKLYLPGDAPVAAAAAWDNGGPRLHLDADAVNRASAVAYWISYRMAAQLVLTAGARTHLDRLPPGYCVDCAAVAYHDARTALCDLRVAAMLAAGHPADALTADGFPAAGTTKGP